jgi:hypothetical protein
MTSGVGGVGSGWSETVLVAFEDAGDAEVAARGGTAAASREYPGPDRDPETEPDSFLREWDALVGGDYSDEQVRDSEADADIGASRLDVQEATMIGTMICFPLLLLLSGTKEETFYRL